MVLQPKLLFYLISNSPYTWFYHLFLLSRNFSTSLGTQGKIYVFMFYYMKRKKSLGPTLTAQTLWPPLYVQLLQRILESLRHLFRNQGLQVPPAPQGPFLLAACKLPQWRPGTVVLRDCHVSPFQTRCFQKLQYLAEPIPAVSGCCRHRCDWPPPPAAASGRCRGPSLPNCHIVVLLCKTHYL